MVKSMESATAIAIDSSIAIDALALGFVPESFAVSGKRRAHQENVRKALGRSSCLGRPSGVEQHNGGVSLSLSRRRRGYCRAIAERNARLHAALPELDHVSDQSWQAHELRPIGKGQQNAGWPQRVGHRRPLSADEGTDWRPVRG